MGWTKKEWGNKKKLKRGMLGKGMCVLKEGSVTPFHTKYTETTF